MNILSITPKIIYTRNIAFGEGVYAPLKFQNNKDVVEISFKGDGVDFSNIKPINLDGAEEISGIHCPGCGVKMLSQKDYDALVKRAENIRTCEEFVELLKEYRKFIPHNMRKILSNTEKPEYYEDKSIRQYYLEHRQEAFVRKKFRIINVKNYLEDYSIKIDKNLRENYLNDVKDINPNESYHIYKNKIMSIVEKYIPSIDDKNLMRRRCLKDVSTSSSYFFIFNIADHDSIPENEIAKILVERIFKNSLPHVVPIQKYSKFIDHPQNKVLVCDNCNMHSTKNVFWKGDSNPKLQDNITKYLSDIAKLMGEGKIESNKSYFNTFCKFSNILSAHKLNFTDNDISHFQNLHRLVGRHEEFEPIVQSKVDIPCAECGSILLPHSVRSNIEDELLDCCCPKEYAQVLQKYQKYIGYYAKDFANIFMNIVKDNPEISNEDFMKIFRKKVDRLSKREVFNALKKYESSRDYILKYRTLGELDAFDKVDTKVRNYIFQGKLDDFVFVNLFNECIADIDLRYSTKSTSVLLYDLNKICYKNTLTRPNGYYDNNDNDAVHTVLFNMFKSDVATADHLIAAAKGGDNSKDNLIALCKTCNNLKSNIGVGSWYSQHYNVRKNFLNQLKVIDNMAKSGELKGFDDWAKNIAQTMYEQTNHIYDKRSEFE